MVALFFVRYPGLCSFVVFGESTIRSHQSIATFVICNNEQI